MNAAPEFFELTLIDCLMLAGTPGLVAFWTTVSLAAAGLLGLKRRFRTASCQAFTLLASLPMVIGFYGVCYFPIAFRTEYFPYGNSEPGTLAQFILSGEAAMPFMIGSFCSCALMFMASILWMRSKEESDGY